MKTSYIMNFIQIITLNSSCFKRRKTQNVTLLFVNNLYEALIQYGIQDGCQRIKMLLFLFFIHKYIFEICMSEICFNCECSFLIYNK